MSAGLVWAADLQVYNMSQYKMTNKIYHNFWGKSKPEYTELERATMEGGHSLEEPVKPQFDFIKSLLVKNSNQSSN